MTKTIQNGKKSILPALNKAGKEIYSFAEILKLTGLKRNYAGKCLSLLEHEGRLVRLEKGLYLYVPEGFEKNWSGSSFVIASRLVYPYALSYWTAMNYWHFTEQIPSTVFIQTTRRKFQAKMEILGVRYSFIQISKKKLFGITTIWDNQNKIRITDKEKTIVDCFDNPRFCGGVGEAAKGLISSLKNNEIDTSRLLRYVERISNMTVAKRLGFLIENIGLDSSGKMVAALQKMIGSGYSLFDPTLPANGKLNSRWKLRVNISNNTLQQMKGL